MVGSGEGKIRGKQREMGRRSGRSQGRGKQTNNIAYEKNLIKKLNERALTPCGMQMTISIGLWWKL